MELEDREDTEDTEHVGRHASQGGGTGGGHSNTRMNLPDDYGRAWDTPGKVRRRGLRKHKKRGKRTSKQAGVVRKPGQRRTQGGDHKHCTCACPPRRPRGCKQASPCTALQTTGARAAWLPGEEEMDPGSASVRGELTKHFHKGCHKITAQPSPSSRCTGPAARTPALCGLTVSAAPSEPASPGALGVPLLGSLPVFLLGSPFGTVTRGRVRCPWRRPCSF